MFRYILRIIFIIFTLTVLGGYIMATWFGWEIVSSGSRSRGMPYIFGYRGGK
ncbi:MAG: hypothetical protein KatS3mg006_0597 [Pyrinomonadaceae bacterium]|jgi:hypothetical protein|nr:MAG: hypothetical protein KatS3mg006_0597 [Pyrinomonadaceae bacterium]